MRTAPVVLALAALVGLTGCPEDCPDCDIPCPPPLPLSVSPPGLLLVGEPARLSFLEGFFLEGGCGNGTSRPTSASSEVYDPLGTLVPSTVLFQGASAPTLVFTPERPGPHHIYVLFSPAGGLHQMDVQVAVDQSAKAPVHVLPEMCQSLERTRQGAWVCDSTIYRGSVFEQRLDGAWLTVAGDVVWAVENHRIRRFVDTGAALALTHALGITSDVAEFLLATPDELLVLHGSTLKRYTPSGNTLLASAPASWSSGGRLAPDASRGLLLRDGDRLAVVSLDSTLRMQACPYQLTATGPVRTQAPCQLLQGTLVGFEPAALWEELFASNTDRRPVLRRWVWNGGQLTEYASQFLGSLLDLDYQPLLRRSSVVPLVRSRDRSDPLIAVVTGAPTERTLLFERLDKQIDGGLASPAFYWGRPARSDSGTPMTIRGRPSSP
jgi:hypothetical protein